MAHGRPADGPDWAIPPKGWGARVDYDKWTDKYTPDIAVALHHGGGGDYQAAKPPFSVEREMAQLRAWEAFHIDGRGWRGLAYGWGLGQSGNVYRIRGWHTYGAHQGDWDGDGVSNNQDTIPVIWIASGNHHEMSVAAHASLVRLRRYLEAESHRTLILKGHQEIQPQATSCPGPKGMAYVRANRHLLLEEDEMSLKETIVDLAFEAGWAKPDNQAAREYWYRVDPNSPEWNDMREAIKRGARSLRSAAGNADGTNALQTLARMKSVM